MLSIGLSALLNAFGIEVLTTVGDLVCFFACAYVGGNDLSFSVNVYTVVIPALIISTAFNEFVKCGFSRCK
jgi:hypothetical protein